LQKKNCRPIGLFENDLVTFLLIYFAKAENHNKTWNVQVPIDSDSDILECVCDLSVHTIIYLFKKIMWPNNI